MAGGFFVAAAFALRAGGFADFAEGFGAFVERFFVGTGPLYRDQASVGTSATHEALVP